MQYFIDNRQTLCEHGGFNPMIKIKGKYISGKVYNNMKETFIKIGNLRVCWGLIQVKKFPSSLIMTYQRAVRDVKFVSNKFGMTCKKIEPLNKLHFLMRALNKHEKSRKEEIF